MSGVRQPGEKARRWQRDWRQSLKGRKGWLKAGAGLAFILGCALLLGLVLPGRQAAPGRAGAPPAPPSSQTPFETAFAQAQRWHLDAQVITKRRLEALEEWDPDNISGSIPEIYRRSLIAGTREIGQARTAAREAARRAVTNDEMYRAARLLAHIERDMGHHKAELEQAKKLVALQPHNPEALMLLERAAKDSGERSPAR